MFLDLCRRLPIAFGIQNLLSTHRTDPFFVCTSLAIVGSLLVGLLSTDSAWSQVSNRVKALFGTCECFVFIYFPSSCVKILNNRLARFFYRKMLLPSVVFLAPDFHGSGVTILANFTSHFSQTIFESYKTLKCADNFFFFRFRLFVNKVQLSCSLGPCDSCDKNTVTKTFKKWKTNPNLVNSGA